MAKFSEVLTIINGKNQSKVENPYGKYPIYGSGGIMGYADDYICEPHTVIIGRKGSINKPIFVETSFWNVDTAFGLCANRDVLLPRYLYYFCEQFDFEKLNTTVTIPSLTKANLLNIEIIVPDISIQKDIVSQLDKVQSIISLRKQQLSKLDELVKSRFIEMFGNLVIGDKICTNKHKIGEIASVTKLAGFEFTKYIQYKEQGDIIMLRGLNCKKGHLVLDDIKWIDKETSDLLPRSKLYYGDILMTYAGTIGDVAMVDADDKYHLAPNVAKITLTDKMAYNPVFLIHLFMYTNDYIMTFASVVAQASINMEKIRNFEYYFPSVEQQNAFATFVEQVDKSKLAIQKSLEKLETLKKALMQKYFG